MKWYHKLLTSKNNRKLVKILFTNGSVWHHWAYKPIQTTKDGNIRCFPPTMLEPGMGVCNGKYILTVEQVNTYNIKW